MKLKKILSIFLALTLMMGLMCASLPAEAEATTTWLDFEAKEMPYYLGDDTDWDAWSIDPSTPYNCATWNSWGYTQQNGAWVVRELVVPSSGTLTVDAIWGAAGYYHGGGEGDTIQFAIANGNKELIYPADGQMKTIAYGEKVDPALSVSVTAGESIYFIMGNPSKAALSYYMASIIRLNGTQLQGENGWHYGNTDGMAVQGGVSQNGAKWYYKYADSVEVTTADPDGYSDNGGGEYTVDYGPELVAMNKISTANGDVNNGWLGDGTYNHTVFTSGMGAYFGDESDSLVVRYTPEGDGDFKIGYAGLELRNSWADGSGVDFCIVDHTGKVVYPESGGVIEIRAGTGDPFDKSSAVAIYQSNLNAGEWLDFVIIPRGTRAASYAKYVYLAGSFTHSSMTTSGNRVDSSGRLFLSNSESQGSRNIQMFTASNVTVNKINTGDWKEFVQLEAAPSAAPATVEAWVNIPTSSPDWKTGTILSDMNGADGTGTAVMMDKFGHPRFVSGNVDWTVDSVDLRTGEWQHIAFTVDAANGVATFYRNGVAVATTTLTEAALAVSGKAPVIGGDLSYASTTAFQGGMKKLALFSDVRTADEIAADMAAVSSSADNILGYWVLNGVYADKTANSNDGTLTQVNSVWYDDGGLADAGEGEYTIVHIGDNQVVTDFFRGGYQLITQWIADNAERLNIQMVLNSGDLVNYANYVGTDTTNDQWQDAVAGMNILKAAGIPYVYAPGNHEYPSSGSNVPRTSAEFNDHFDIVDHLTQAKDAENETKLIYAYPSTNKISSTADLMLLENNTTGVTSYGNTYVETMENAVYLAELGGKLYAILALEVQPRFVVTDWAHTVMQALEAEYADITTVVVTHDYMSSSGTLVTYNSCFNAADRAISHTPASLYSDFLSQYKSISMVFCGHVATGISTRTDIGANGNKIVTIMNDQSYEGNGGEGNILLLRCKADGTVIKAEYYSPILEKYYVPQYQFDFDTAADSDLELSLPTMTNMEAGNGSDRWYVKNSTVGTMMGGALVGGTLLAAHKDYTGIRTFVPTVSGTASYTMGITYISASATASSTDEGGNTVKTPLFEMILCKDDGTVVWPADGKWHSVTAKETFVANFEVKAGEAIHLIGRMKDTTKTQAYINVTSTVAITDAEGVTSTYISNNANSGISYTEQGVNGWYANYLYHGSQITTVPASYTVTYGVDGEGGTIGASTSGTWGAETCTIPAGGTVRFTAKPDTGYRIVGYYVDGVYYRSTRRILTLPMIEEDMDVKVVFEKIPVVGDANNDGVVDVLDAVHLNVGIATDAAIIDDTVCDLVDDIAATDGVDILDIDDVKALRKEILG
ncbi:MAG: metallophosphoesterase [Clostridia bacterium]|nr:metallophosphoesterase [Clostridia bacterium]